MPDLVLTCPECGHEMRVPEEAFGSRGRCSGCGAVVTANEQTTRYLDDAEARHVAQTGRAERQAGREDVPPGACARCGNPFRGDWDTHATNRGVICDRCARLATEMPAMPAIGGGDPAPGPVSFAGEGVEYEANAVRGLEPVVTERVESTQVPGFARNWPGLFRGLLWAAAAGILLLSLSFYLSDDDGRGTISEAKRSAVEQGVPDEDPPIPVPVFMWMLLGTNLLAVVTAVYLTLDHVNRLPDDRFLVNILLITPWSILLYVPNILLLAPMVLGGYGAIYAALAPVGFIVFLILVLYIRFDCPFSAFLMYPVFNFLGTFLAFLVSRALFGAIGLLFT
jgi:hypothetical protein